MGPFLFQEGKLSPTVANVTEHPIRPGLDPGLLIPVCPPSLILVSHCTMPISSSVLPTPGMGPCGENGACLFLPITSSLP